MVTYVLKRTNVTILWIVAGAMAAFRGNNGAESPTELAADEPNFVPYRFDIRPVVFGAVFFIGHALTSAGTI